MMLAGKPSLEVLVGAAREVPAVLGNKHTLTESVCTAH
jgi:hypothetical protein